MGQGTETRAAEGGSGDGDKAPGLSPRGWGKGQLSWGLFPTSGRKGRSEHPSGTCCFFIASPQNSLCPGSGDIFWFQQSHLNLYLQIVSQTESQLVAMERFGLEVCATEEVSKRERKQMEPGNHWLPQLCLTISPGTGHPIDPSERELRVGSIMMRLYHVGSR